LNFVIPSMTESVGFPDVPTIESSVPSPTFCELSLHAPSPPAPPPSVFGGGGVCAIAAAQRTKEGRKEGRTRTVPRFLRERDPLREPCSQLRVPGNKAAKNSP
jgi:hypothetical protein